MVQIRENPLILVDGSSYLYRAYYAFPPLTNREGEPTGAIYGVLKMLRSLITRYHSTHAAVIFDAKENTFRKELFEYYKSHRPPIPNNLRIQINPLFSMIKAMGLPLIQISGVEADDVIGTLARSAEKDGHSVLISTSDKDMAQLVTPNILLINTITNTILGPEEVLIKYGVPPELIIDFISLIGDQSDNIPGAPGIGRKTALILLKKLGGIDELYNKLEKIPFLTFRGAKTMAAKLANNREIVYLSHKLATIQTKVDIDFTFKELEIQNPLIEKLLDLFKRYDFNKWVDDIEEGRWL